MKILVGEGSCGIAAGAGKVFSALKKALPENIRLEITGCIGMCYLEPIVDIYKDDTLIERLVNVSPNDASLIAKAIKTNDLSLVSGLRIVSGEKDFYEKQTRIVLRNCGLINPENIDDYIKKGGYESLKRAVLSMTAQQVLDEIKLSGLKGRGGAGFPTWFKWNAAKEAPGDAKYLICNADEGDPGAFMDRAVIESDPHSLIEGMLIGAYVIGARQAVVYIRAEYPLAIQRLEIAALQAMERGFLGESILGSDFSCSIRIKAGAGAFVCGEETALIESLEGNRGTPRIKPPFPAQSGYLNKPTNINNVETFANIPWILFYGGGKYSALGTKEGKGTKVFALTGKIKRGGLVEIPLGKTLREVIYEIGGGIRNDKNIKAVQLGGPSGGCIPENLLDTVIDYESLSKTGAIMGSGGMVVMDENTCMVNMAKFFLDFTAKESCGKCTHCRIGTKRILEILERITKGEGHLEDIDSLKELCLAVKDGSLCGLGQTAPNPVLTTLDYFLDEYEAHITEKRCPAGECIALRRYEIEPDKCTGCTLCAKKCPVNAIYGKVKQIHTVNNDLCIKCGECYSVCRFGAVKVR